MLWILKTGAQCYPNYKSVHRVVPDVLAERGKGVKIMAIVDRCGLPLSIGTHSTISRRTWSVPRRTQATHTAEVKKRGVGMIAPHRRNRTRPKTQDGRRLLRYKRRWIVEWFSAWLQWNLRVLIRWEYHAENFPGFVQFAALCQLLRPLYY